MKAHTKPGIFSVICLNVGTMIGSGWLFASYYAAKDAGGASILSWIIGAAIILIMALMLSEIAIRYPTNALFTRLITLSHNNHFGFVIGLSNWLLSLIVIPSEAIATAQYVAGIYKPWTPYIFAANRLTLIGILMVIFFMGLYFMLNYWGVRLLSKINNAITFVKLVIPIFTTLIIMAAAFDTGNFTAYHNSFAPMGASSIFYAIVHSGIFYSFFGFQIAVAFTAELKRPERNIPIALVSSVLIVLAIYLILQVAFIGALPSEMIAKGWHSLNFESPLAQLAALIGINFLAVILYADACVSPSGTGLIYLGASARMLNEMVKNKQMPAFMGNPDGNVQFSRRSLTITFIASLILVLFFNNWQLIASLTTTFILISCLALPVAHTQMSVHQKQISVKILPFCRAMALFIFLCLSYLLLLAGTLYLCVALLLHVVMFLMYSYAIQGKAFKATLDHFKSSWSIFFYLIIVAVFARLHSTLGSTYMYYIAFIILTICMFFCLVHQKGYGNVKS